MAWVTRYRIEDGARVFNGTEFTTEKEDAFQYRSEGQAYDDAEEFGGEVVKFSRYDKNEDIVFPSQVSNPIVHGAVIGRLEAAE
ncbi:hypothetical protein N5C81_15075 [Rhizobium pusense]|uniref:hypothetical protein n=1 Tax=Agrobacterium pusense TaxID=648995 RepID=UPI002448A214|nr:hypothetical protein [Agrobacterium pusense]MDH1268946.1 hypothetical protein [Agrobacterium pusense]